MNLLAPGGALERTIPHYEDRPEQRQMAVAVGRALAERQPLLVEAGTGTGKTLAYLIPALQHGGRVIISTGTRALQDQIYRHDIPLLRTIVAKPFTAVVLKGVSNYVCRRRLVDAAAQLDLGLNDHGKFATKDRGVLADVLDWSEHTESGDRSEVDWLAEDAPLWRTVTTTPESRLGPRCPYFDRCFVTQARRSADKAELVLVNHHLYFADLVLRSTHPGARVVPEHDAVIFDEAHQLEDVATEHFGARVSTHKLASLVRDAHHSFLANALRTNGNGIEATRSVERAGAALFALVRSGLGSGTLEEPRVQLPDQLFERPAYQAAWFRFDTALEQLARVADADGELHPSDLPDDPSAGARASVAAVARRVRALRDDLATIAEQRHRSHVYWAEVRATSTSITASPIDVAELMRRYIVTASPTPIFTSATLATASAPTTARGPEPSRLDFSFHRARFGLPEDAGELIVDSPFDYTRQALLYLPRDLPSPHDDSFAEAAALRCRELLELSHGRAFLLFTSYQALREAATRLVDISFPMLVQGDAPRASLVDRFRATPGAVLLGTASFWEGVDVPGDALSLVVIDKLPFAVPSDPLVAARIAAIAEAGGDPFASRQLPQAAIALKQGFGRLIRRRDDRGIVAILDHRIVTRTYGRVLLDTLPAGLPRTSTLERVRGWWKQPQST